MKGDGAVAFNPEDRTSPQHLDHAFDMRAVGLGLRAGVLDAVAIDVDRCRDCSLEAEWPGDPNDSAVHFRPIDEHLFAAPGPKTSEIAAAVAERIQSELAAAR